MDIDLVKRNDTGDWRIETGLYRDCYIRFVSRYCFASR